MRAVFQMLSAGALLWTMPVAAQDIAAAQNADGAQQMDSSDDVGTSLQQADGSAAVQQDWQATGLDSGTPQPTSAGRRAGIIADSSVGKVGERQGKQATVANIKPLARLDTRIANRVETRIRNRIDRTYDPTANATSPFKVAIDKAQKAGSLTQD